MRYAFSARHPVTRITIVGFLDDLKRQAEAIKTQQTVDVAALARNTALADAACKSVLQYWMELAPQLNVLQPRAPMRFSLDNRTALEGLVRCDFRVDSRRKQLRGQEVFDHVVLHAFQKSGRAIKISKDFPPEIERLESRLRQAGITADVTIVRDPNNGRLEEVRYVFTADVVLMLRLLPDHDHGRLRFQINNLDSLETVNVEFAAHAVTSALLDELSRWLTGDTHEFLKQGENLRRVEA